MTRAQQPRSPRQPVCLLILGTDASGKNHVANVISEYLFASGHGLEKREGSFSAPASDAASSEDKGLFSLMKEYLFIRAYPLLRPVICPVLTLLLNRDLGRFRPAAGNLLVISNTVLRVLAFHLGHAFASTREISLPAGLEQALGRIAATTGMTTMVLDIDHGVRSRRVRERLRRGKADYFDRYLAADHELSERIEEFLIWLATTYLGARVVINNDLSDQEIIAGAGELLAGKEPQA